MPPQQLSSLDIGTLIHQAVETEAARIIKDEQEELQARVAARMRGSVGMIASKVLHNFSYHRGLDNDLIITVKFAFGESQIKP